MVTADREGATLLWRDQVVRHDMHLQKKGTILGGKLANVPFLITNVTTGEAHVAVTDRNGMLSTSSDWRSRQNAVNANDGLLAEDYVDTADVEESSGIWFGQGEDGSAAEPDDRLGALPFGEYRIEELRCEANEGYALWSDTFNVSRDTTATGFDIDLGTVDDEPIPKLATEATDKADGDHVLASDGKVTVVDEVAYANLVPGNAYKVKGTLMDKATGEPLHVGGKPVEGETGLSPEASNGFATVSFEFDGAGLEGADIVIFETLYRDGEAVCEHADLDNANQTVRMTEPVPEIGTTATDADDGDHEAVADDSVTIVDEVRYENLEPGREYVLTGTLIDKTIAEPVKADGLPLTSVVAFTPGELNGSVQVEFSFDGSQLAGHCTVAFESLALDGEIMATHEDIEDEGQSVDLVTPPSPESPKAGLAQTGDTNNVVSLICLAIMAALIAALTALRERRSKRKGSSKSEETGE